MVTVGVLGAARIVKTALLRPAAQTTGIDVVSVAARSFERATAYAAKHRIPAVHRRYEDLLADPSVEAVYIALPAALHAEWTTAAIEAGKHVLTEKPFTSNAAAAESVSMRAAAAEDVIVMEAYHSHYHPLQARLRDILASNELGEIRAARATFCVPIPPGKDIRWNYALGGGALLDVGYYPVRQLTELFGSPSSVSASAAMRGDIDRFMTAHLRFSDGVLGNVTSSIWSRRLFGMSLSIEGCRGRLAVRNPYQPQLGGRLTVRSGTAKRIEVLSRRSSYVYQLEAFRDAVISRRRAATGPVEAANHIRVLDSIYTAAGVPLRP